VGKMTKKEKDKIEVQVTRNVIDIKRLIQNNRNDIAFVKYLTAKEIFDDLEGYGEKFRNLLEKELLNEGYSQTFIDSFISSYVNYREGIVNTVK
jgi:hypothetical protein